MSRSFKKHPIVGTACAKPKSITDWKRQRARCVRRMLDVSEESISMQVVKKLVNPYDHPTDGNHWAPEYRKSWRK